MKLHKSIIILTLNLPFFITQIYYVSPQTNCDNFCDGSLPNPYPNIQTALSFNNSLQITLILMDGMYIGNYNINLNIDAMQINISSLNGPSLTIFDCQHSTLFYIKNTIFYFYNVTIMNCYKLGIGDPSDNTSGGAIIIDSGTLYLENLIFLNNIASYGGALSCLNSQCYISSSVFYNNRAATNGGAIYALNSYLEIDSNINITSNSAGQNGGGIYCENGSFLATGSNYGFYNNSILSYYSSDFSCKNGSGTVDLAKYTGLSIFSMDCDQCVVNNTCTSGNCMKSCPCRSRYFNSLTQTCSSCPSPGQTCGKNNPSCVSNCKPKCYCLTGYFCNGTGCLACNSTCSSCLNQTSCLGCSDPTAILDTLTGVCVTLNSTNTSDIGVGNSSLNTSNTSNNSAVINTSSISSDINSSNLSNSTNTNSNNSDNEMNSNTSINASTTNTTDNSSTSTTEQINEQNSTEKINDNKTMENDTFEEEIDFKLGYTVNLNVISLTFLQDSPFLSTIHMKNSTFSIDSFIYPTDYIVVFENISVTEYLIHFFYSKPLIGRKLFTIKPQNIAVSRSITLFDFYEVSYDDLQLIQSSAEQYEALGATAKLLFMLNNIAKANGGSVPGVVRNLMILELIFMLKFIDLNYPSNLMRFFIETSHGHIKYLYKDHLHLESEDSEILPLMYEVFEISPYFLDNAGDFLLQNIFFLYLGLFLIGIDRILHLNDKPSFIFKILTTVNLFLKHSIVWEFTVFLFFVTFPEILVRILITLKFQPKSNPKGILNILLAIFSLFTSIYVFSYLFYIRRKIHQLSLSIEHKPNFKIHSENFGEEKTNFSSPIHRKICPEGTLKLDDKMVKSPKTSDKIFLKTDTYSPEGKNINENAEKAHDLGFRESIHSQTENEIKEDALPSNSGNIISLNIEEENNANENRDLSNKPTQFTNLAIQINEKNSQTQFANLAIQTNEKNSPNNLAPKNGNSEDKNDPLELVDLETPIVLLRERVRLENAKRHRISVKDAIIENPTENNIYESQMSYKFNDSFLNSERKLLNDVNAKNKVLLQKQSEENMQILQSSPKLSIFEENKSPETEQNSQLPTEKNILALNEIFHTQSPEKGKQSKSWFKPQGKAPNLNEKPKTLDKNHLLLISLEHKYEVLCAEFKKERFLHRNFIFLDFLRQTLFLTIIISSEGEPFVKIIIVFTLQLMYIIATWIIRPFNAKYPKLNFAITELFMTTAVFSCFLIGCYDYYGVYDTVKRTKLGWVVPYCNLGLLYWMLLAMTFKILAKILYFVRSHKSVHHTEEHHS